MSGGSAGWLFDTNVISEVRKGPRGQSSLRRWIEGVPSQRCFLSAVSVAELRLGIESTADAAFRDELEAWLERGVRVWFGVRLLAVSEDVLLTWRRLVLAGQRARYTYSPADALIAATALVHDLGVVTRNTADFERAGVTLVNPWLEG